MRFLPFDIIKHILGFDKRFIIKGDNITNIGKINRYDKRYKILLKIPKKIYDKDDIDSIAYVFLKINKEKCYCIIYDCINNTPRFQIQLIGMSDFFTFFETSDYYFIK
jgi:hypothetical protein